MGEKEKDKENFTFRETLSMIIACYQVFLPVFFCILAALILTFLLLGFYL